MLYKWLLMLKQPSNRLWVVPSYWTIVTILFLFSLRLGENYFPSDWLPTTPQDTLDWLLSVIASSMLAVSTFSLSIMVSAFSAAANSATPRALDLVMDDRHTRMAISSFICAFIYALIAKTALGMQVYGQNGRFILFISTIGVLVYLIITLISWVYTLSQLGRLGNTLTKIEQAAQTALEQYQNTPTMGATLSYAEQLHQSHSLAAQCCGYLTHIDMQSLQQWAAATEARVHIDVRPGELIAPDSILCRIEGEQIDEAAIRNCFVFSRSRTFEQDPAWGFIVLSEAAQRALSPAVNDPGTAINVMSIMMKLLTQSAPTEPQSTLNYDCLSIKALDTSEFVRDGFAPISRDGAAILEVNLVMQKALASIWRNNADQTIAQAAKIMAIQALERAQQQLGFEPEKQLLSEKHQELFE